MSDKKCPRCGNTPMSEKLGYWNRQPEVIGYFCYQCTAHYNAKLAYLYDYNKAEFHVKKPNQSLRARNVVQKGEKQ